MLHRCTSVHLYRCTDVQVYTCTGAGPGGAVNVEGRRRDAQAHGQVGATEDDIRDDVSSGLGMGLRFCLGKKRLNSSWHHI